MVKVKVNEDVFYMDGYMKSSLDNLKKLVDLKWDGLFYICGYEGDGKTTIGSQAVYYLDPTITLDRVAFTSDQFMEYCLAAEKKQAILFDESFMAFNNRALWSKSTQNLISMLTMIRKKQLFIVIIAPTFFDIQKYIAIHRSRFLIEVYASGLERGFFRLFNRQRKHQLYIKGKRDHNMKIVKPNLRGRYGKFFPFDEKEYDEKKESATQELKDSKKKQEEVMSPAFLNKLKRDSQTEILVWLKSNLLLKRGTLMRLAQYYEESYSNIKQKLSQHPNNIKTLENVPKSVNTA